MRRTLTSNCASYIETLFAIFGMNCATRLKPSVQTPSCALELPASMKGHDFSTDTEDIKQFLQQKQAFSTELDTQTRTEKKEGKKTKVSVPDTSKLTEFCAYMQLHKPDQIKQKMNDQNFTVYILEIWLTSKKLWHTCKI